VWQRDVPHWFFLDLGVSGGMKFAERRCRDLGAPATQVWLRLFHHASFVAFERGDWPPHTRSFELVQVASEDLQEIEADLRKHPIGRSVL
jgi:hypothetical protein